MSLSGELADVVHTACSGLGVSLWNESTQTGLLFEPALPPDGSDAVSIGTRRWAPGPNNLPGYHRVEVHIDSQGAPSVEDKHWIVTKFLRERLGTERMFRPIDLTSWRIEGIEWTDTGPGLVEAFIKDKAIAFRWKQRFTLIVKEK